MQCVRLHFYNEFNFFVNAFLVRHCIFAAAVAGTNGNILQSLLALPFKRPCFFVFLPLIEGGLLYPIIVFKSVCLPGLLLLFASMIGAGLGGIMGMIINVPLCSVFYALFSDYIKRLLQTKKMNDI